MWVIMGTPGGLLLLLILETFTGSTSADLSVRLVNSEDRCSGRVEVSRNGQWGTVCADFWDLNDANVVCRQLGCGRARSALTNAAFGEGRGPIWLDDVKCLGDEPSLTDCQHQGWGVHNCGHSKDAGVVCESDLPVRLVNSEDRCSGRVEIFHAEHWGTVCDDAWDLNDANVVCRQVGCGRAQSALSNAAFGEGSGPIWLAEVSCSGNEGSITECRHPPLGVTNCRHSEDAGVVCESDSPVRLVNSDDRCSGRVELYHNGQWGTVCDDDWDLSDANVVCKQLGCGRAQSAKGDAFFGQGSGPIWLDRLACFGNEQSITECSHPGFGVHKCGHNEDAGVVCESASPVRLVNSDDRCSGRVEIFHAGQWGTVCDDNWDLNDANVVCRQLGCGKARSALPNAAFGQGSGPIWLDNVGCSGYEELLTHCGHAGLGTNNCYHGEDASVICEVQWQFNVTALRTTHEPGLPGDAEVKVDIMTTKDTSTAVEKQASLSHEGKSSSAGGLSPSDELPERNEETGDKI